MRERTPIPHKAVRVRDGINTEPGRKNNGTAILLRKPDKNASELKESRFLQ